MMVRFHAPLEGLLAVMGGFRQKIGMPVSNTMHMFSQFSFSFDFLIHVVPLLSLELGMFDPEIWRIS